MCESKTEVSTPFWASNSNGKVMTVLWRMIDDIDDNDIDDDNNDNDIEQVRAILNNKEFEQAVHQEICT